MFSIKVRPCRHIQKIWKNENWKLHAFFNAKLHIGFYQFLAFVSDLHWISVVESTVNPPKYQLGPFKWPLDGRITLWDIYNSIQKTLAVFVVGTWTQFPFRFWAGLALSKRENIPHWQHGPKVRRKYNLMLWWASLNISRVLRCFLRTLVD